MEKIVNYSVIGKKTNFKRVKVDDPRKVYDFTKKLYKGTIDVVESVYCIFLNTQLQIIGYSKIGQGSINSCQIDMRVIGKMVCDVLPDGFILIHNHPSGNLNPSVSDNKLTDKLREVCGIFDLHEVDHLIVTSGGYYSYKSDQSWEV